MNLLLTKYYQMICYSSLSLPKDLLLFFSQCLHVPVIYTCLQTYWLMSHILTKRSMCRRVMEMLDLSNIHSAGRWVCIHSVSSDLCCSSGQKETCNTPSPSTAPLIGHARASAGLGQFSGFESPPPPCRLLVTSQAAQSLMGLAPQGNTYSTRLSIMLRC